MFVNLKKEWLNIVYIIFLGWIMTNKFNDMITPGSAKLFYYQFLYVFDPRFYISFICAWIQIACNILSLIPLFFCVLHRCVLPTIVWKILFGARFIFDVIGHNYELNSYTSFFHANVFAAIIISLATLLILLPSYAMTFEYAFCREKLKQKWNG